MRHRLISEWVEFRYSVVWREQGGRRWSVDNELHRNDDGPAYEYINDGYCQWWEHGKFVKSVW